MYKSAIISSVFFVMLLFVTLTGNAQLKCKIERYSTENGLSHDGVTTIIKDREGFMWFGTWDGINRFDGHQFVAYKAYPGDRSSLKNNRIVSILEDQSGFLWLKAYDNQIYRFDKRTESFFPIADLLHAQGIKNIIFSSIIVANEGFVWLTTNNQGLFCVKNSDSDHPEIIRYAAGQAAGFSLSSNTINFLYQDKENTVWLGTPKGLNKLTKNKSGVFTNKNIKPDSLAMLNFISVVEGNTNIWFGTSDGNLVFFEKQTKLFTKLKLSNSSINSLCLSAKRPVLYLSTSQSQLITVNTSDLNYAVATMPAAGPFLSLFEDSTGNIWIEPEKQGVIKFNPAARAFTSYSQPKDATFHPSVKVYEIFEDHKKRLWVSMQGGGFGYYHPEEDEFKYFYNKPGSIDQQLSNFVPHSYLDPSGVLWLSTNDRGIDKIILQEDNFKHLLLEENTANKSDNEIRGVCNDSRNRIWLASKSGKLHVYHNGEPVTGLFSNMPSGGLGIIYTILETKNGIIWLGTKGNGLFKATPLDSDRSKYELTHFLPDKNDVYSLSSDFIYTILEDRKGRIWVGTYGEGLNLLEQTLGKVRFINDKNTFKQYPRDICGKIRHLNEGPNGDIWIGTTDGLLLLNPNKGTKYDFKRYGKISGDPSSLGYNDVQFIFKDSKNAMWVCTSGGGFNQAYYEGDKLKFKTYTKEDGLPNDYILSAAEDNEGNFWLATENGISKFETKTLQFRNYDAYDGLPKTGFSEAAGIKLLSGNLLFGARTGYLIFNPAEIIHKKTTANLALTNFQVNNKNVGSGGPGSPLKQSINFSEAVELAYDENTIGIEFAVLDYLSAKQEYAYRLVGFDKEWQQVKNQRKATYTNLPPGDYTFEVKSMSSELYENLPLKQLAVTIHPPIWRTAWAYLLYVILALILLEVIRRVSFSMLKLRNRIAIEQKVTELKLRFFTNISHELRTPLTLIINPIEAISNQEDLSPKSREYIDVVRKNANRMVRFINHLLDFRKAQSGKMKLKVGNTEIVSFVKDIASHFTEAATEKQITLLTTSNVKQLFAWIDSEKIDIVFYNLLSNAIKFSPNGKEIKIEIIHFEENDYFTIKVIDHGIGVPANKLNEIFELYYEVEETNNLGGTGIGLALTKELVELHHGSITAANNSTEGLTVTVNLKAGKEHFRNDEVVFVDIPQEIRKKQPVTAVTTDKVVLEATTATLASMPSVLIVDDNSELRKFLADQLSIYYRIVEAEDGEEGFEKAVQQLPDLILSDIMMPKMDGIQLLDKLKHNKATSHIPIILLTAKTSVEHQIEGLNFGADYYITKPFQTDFILASIKNLLIQRKKLFEALLTDRKTIALSPGEIVITDKDEKFLREVISIVENGMANPEFNIDAVAETVGMGRTTFYKKFTSLTNLAPVEFVREMRLKRGMQLLEAGESNISEIAYAIGFNNAGYFSTCFKKKYNFTPSEYLKSLKPVKA